jgi:hypothetical protein
MVLFVWNPQIFNNGLEKESGVSDDLGYGVVHT